VLIGMLDQEQV